MSSRDGSARAHHESRFPIVPTRRLMFWKILGALFGVGLATVAVPGLAAQRQGDPGQLEKLRKRHPEADADRDGTPTLGEAQAYIRKLRSSDAAAPADFFIRAGVLHKAPLPMVPPGELRKYDGEPIETILITTNVNPTRQRLEGRGRKSNTEESSPRNEPGTSNG